MAKPQLTKNWSISPNVRYTPFVSLAACMGWWLYRHKAAMIAAGWTVKFSCDGVTGPANANDTTDRWVGDASPVVRAAAAAAAQSWIVLTNVDGVQVLFTFQGASDDIARVSMSQSGAFTLAGTTTHQPTAADEVLCTSGNSLINSTAAGDRVMSIGCTNESWWSATFRANAIIYTLGIEKIDPAVSSSVLAKPYVVHKYTTSANTSEAAGGFILGGCANVSVGATNWLGVGSRVFTGGAFRLARFGGGRITLPGRLVNAQGAGTAFFFSSHVPPLQNGNSIVLLPIHWFGHTSEDPDGYLGTPIDWWWSIGTSNTTYGFGDTVAALDYADAQGDAVRANWLIILGGAFIRPWKNAAPSLETA